MNTDVITLTKIEGTDSVASSRITINSNFSKLAKVVSDIQTRIDTSKNTIYINTIETESGDFVIKTTPNHTTRFRINNVGEVYIGNLSLDEYIKNVIKNTNFVELNITDADDNELEYSNISNVVTIYTNDDTFNAFLSIHKNLLELYPNAVVEIYDGTTYDSGTGLSDNCLINNNNGAHTMPAICFFDEEPDNDGIITSGWSFMSNNKQNTILIIWMPNSSLHEKYSFKVEKI